MNMIKRSISKILTLTALLTSCQQDEVKVEEREFVHGDVIVGVRSNIAIDKVFELMNENQLTIDQMSGFFSYSLFPNDSLTFINKQLVSKTYLNKRGWSNQVGNIADNRILLTTFFFEMDKTSQIDWLETIQKCKLVDLQGDTKNLLVKVVPGTEKKWLAFFKSHPYIKWAELNEYIQIGRN
jgi:hypothetical protein